MNWTTIAQIPVLVFALWLFTTLMTRSFPILQGKRVLLLIAHPDDEAMFFAPTLLTLTRPELGNQVLILCLSSGDADGLGSVRKEELKKSAQLLGVRPEHVVVVEDENFQDSMTVTWDAKLISSLLARYFAPDMAKSSTSSAPTASLDAIVTFDLKGVSGHPNHISLYHGAATFLRSLMQRHTGWECPVRLYTLTTTNVVRKYSSVLDCLMTVLSCIWRTKDKGHFPTPLLMVNGPLDTRKAQNAMTTAHKSQMRWFRWGWIGISRYMVINDLTRQKVV
jgi:N-acetylglucosaminylphosphatidylinositol deacetylase